MSDAPSKRRRGTVGAFDDAAGLGVIHSGEARWPFHCTAIADGSRRIAEEAPVEFVLRAAHHGRWEATDIHTLG